MRTRFVSLLLCAAALASLAAWSVSTAQAAALRDTVRVWRKSHEQAIVGEFVTFLAMPDVATNVADVDKNAAYIQQQLRARGFTTQLLTAAPGTPASVFA